MTLGLVSAQEACQEDLRSLIPSADVDEMSLLFPDGDTLDRFVNSFVHGGFGTNFNNVEDTIYPANGKPFKVSFRFLRIDGLPWRIEAMAVTDGISLLHQDSLLSHTKFAYPYPIIHASFKAKSIAEFFGNVSVLAGNVPTKIGYTGGASAGRYFNSYGVFEYFGSNGEGPYLKPRVSFRDLVGE